MDSLVVNAYRTNLDATHDADLLLIAVDATQTPTRAMQYASEITAEVTGPDYARVTATGRVFTQGATTVADYTTDPELQLNDVDEIAGIWTCLIPADWDTLDTSLELVAFNAVAVGAGFADWPVQRSNGYARVTALELANMLAGLGDVAATDDDAPTHGQALVYDGVRDLWAPGDAAGGDSDADPVACPPGTVTDVVVADGLIVAHKYVFREVVDESIAAPLLALPPAADHIGQVITQMFEINASTGPVVEVIPPDPARKPSLDFTAWVATLATTDFGAGDSVDFDLDGATVTATFTGSMDPPDIISALLTPLVTAGATYTSVGSILFVSSPTDGGSLSITDPGTELDFASVVEYGLGGFIRAIDNTGGGLDADLFYGPGTDNTDYTFIGAGFGTHSSPTGGSLIQRGVQVVAIPDRRVWSGARWTAVDWPIRSEFIPYALAAPGGTDYESNVHTELDKLLDFQSDAPGTYGYEVTLTDVDGVNVPTITLTTPGGSGVTLSDSDPLGLSVSDAGTGTEAARDDHVHPLPSLVTLGAAASADFVAIAKPATETLNTDTTLQNDDDLTFAIGASQKWLVDILCFVYGPAGADLKVAVTVPSGATMLFGVEGLPTSASSLPSAEQQIAVLGTSGTSTSVATFGGLSIVKLTGTVSNSTNAGNVTLQWAQAASSGTNVEVRALSRLTARKPT